MPPKPKTATKTETISLAQLMKRIEKLEKMLKEHVHLGTGIPPEKMD